jgi:hypothetical protein
MIGQPLIPPINEHMTWNLAIPSMLKLLGRK